MRKHIPEREIQKEEKNTFRKLEMPPGKIKYFYAG
jgi:hypothetical protein